MRKARQAKRKSERLIGKRGVSPLIATVLLIAFAVALGAVVMNWGRTQIQDQILTEEECRLVELSWFRSNNIERVCHTDDKVIFTLQNSNQRIVDNIKLIIAGDKDEFIINDSILKRPIGKSEPRKKEYSFDIENIGKPIQIQLIPVLEKSGKRLICPNEQALIKEGIPACK